jgi:hypothetical protein
MKEGRKEGGKKEQKKKSTEAFVIYLEQKIKFAVT